MVASHTGHRLRTQVLSQPQDLALHCHGLVGDSQRLHTDVHATDPGLHRGGRHGIEENVERFRAQLAGLEREKAEYDRMKPDEYPAPAAGPAQVTSESLGEEDRARLRKVLQDLARAVP